MSEANSAASTGGQPSGHDRRGDLGKTSTYQVDGKQFIVEPVFRQDGRETIGTILVRLMQSDANRI